MGKQAKSEALAVGIRAKQACRSHPGGANCKAHAPNLARRVAYAMAQANLSRKRNGRRRSKSNRGREDAAQQQSLTRRGRQMMAPVAATWPSSPLGVHLFAPCRELSVLFRPSACPSVLICLKTELGRPHCPASCRLLLFLLLGHVHR